MSTKRSPKKLRASFVAGTLAAAIALTGTFAWQSISQMTVNEFYTVKNPGARLHDDFNGLNKDVFAENFTEPGSGLPVLVRVRLSEYMETGRDAGVKRNDPARSVTLADGLDPASVDINRPETWPIHKPGDTTDKFHASWLWDLGGSTVYMPTFNKNKDSLSVDVNGTYVGTDGVFETGDPYDDYVIYTTDPAKEDLAKKIVHSKTADAYYDGDEDDDDDEWVTTGTGGPDGNGGLAGTDYIAVQETHTATTTRGATVLTMAEWQAMGSPVGDYWVWDEDGWAYWAAPLMPKEATGALLTGVRQATDSADKCYYAISVEGQFVTKDDIGTEADKDGFYNGPFSDAAKELVEKIKSVAAGKNGKWYVDLGHNIYQEMDPVTGQKGAEICAGLDRIIGTTDDKTGIIRTDTAVSINGTDSTGNPVTVDCGTIFLAPDSEFPYYRAMGNDDELGTDDDIRIWHSGSEAFPGGSLALTGAKTVKVVTTAGETTAQVVAGGKLTFKATVYKDDAGTDTGVSQDVTWTVTGASNANTYINDKGELTVASDQATGTDKLTVIAKAKADDRAVGQIKVSVLGKDEVYVSVTPDGNDTNKVRAGTTQQFSAKVTKGVTTLNSTITWSITETYDPASGDDITMSNTGLLNVPYAVPAGSKITVTASATVDGIASPVTGSFEVEVTDGATPRVTVTGDDTIEAGTAKTYGITLDIDEITDKSATWTLVSPTGVTGLDIDSASGELTVPNNLAANTTITIQATASAEAKNATATKEVRVAEPKSVTVSGEDKVKKGDSIKLSAVVNGASGVYGDGSNLVTWRVEGGSASSISADGTLTVQAGETAKTLTVVAKSAIADVEGTKVVRVGGDGVDIGSVTPGSTATVKIDNIEWYVLAKNGDTALILSKNILEDEYFHSSKKNVTWDKSTLRTYLNETWLNGKATLKQYAQATSIQVRSSGSSTSYNTATSDKVFLLSEADVFGTENYGRMSGSDITKAYTPGVTSALKAPGGSWAAAGGSYNVWWLRSPSYVSSAYPTSAANVSMGGTADCDYTSSERGVRPALWIAIQ